MTLNTFTGISFVNVIGLHALSLIAGMYNHQKSSSLDSEKINRVDIPKAETATFPTSKSVRISDETFYLGSTQSDSISKGITSGKESPDSTYFSSIISDTSEGAENGEILLCYVSNFILLKYGFILTFFVVVFPDNVSVER